MNIRASILAIMPFKLAIPTAAILVWGLASWLGIISGLFDFILRIGFVFCSRLLRRFDHNLVHSQVVSAEVPISFFLG
jgi:hypothetical protein